MVTMSQRQPRVGVPITASVTDLDGDVSNVTWQWSEEPTTESGGSLWATSRRPRRPPISQQWLTLTPT